MATEALHRVVGVLDAPLGLAALGDRGQEAEQDLGALARGRIRIVAGNVQQRVGMQGQQPGTFHQRLLGQQHAPHVRVDDDRIGRLFRELGARQRTGLQALAGVAQGVLVGALGHRQALQAHAQAGRIHHLEHRLQALVRLADQVAGGAVEVHHAGHRAVDAHLVLDAATTHRVASGQAAVGIDVELGHHEQRDALGAGHRVGQPRQHQVDDVRYQVVLTAGDEDLGAGDGVIALAVGFGAGLEQAQVGAGMRLGQAHRAGPLARHQAGEEHLLLPVAAVVLQRLHRAVAEHREVAPGQVGAIDHLGDRRAQGVRHALAAMFDRIAQPRPAALDEKIERLLEPRRRDHIAGGRIMAAANLVTDGVERRQHGVGKACALLQHRIDDVIGRLRVTQLGEQRLCAQDIVQCEAQVGDGRTVAAHGAPWVVGLGGGWLNVCQARLIPPSRSWPGCAACPRRCRVPGRCGRPAAAPGWCGSPR